MTSLNSVYLSLGGNLGNPLETIQRALNQIAELPGIKEFKSSSLYSTTPVSRLPQPNFINAVCSFKTTLEVSPLFQELKKIEYLNGKNSKPKEAPRPIDIDILFFGLQIYRDSELEIPHPRWKERLFVLIPLSELVELLPVPSPEEIQLINLKTFIQAFPNPNKERVSRYNII